MVTLDVAVEIYLRPPWRNFVGSWRAKYFIGGAIYSVIVGTCFYHSLDSIDRCMYEANQMHYETGVQPLTSISFASEWVDSDSLAVYWLLFLVTGSD